jgi:hypothetical protein
LSASPQLLTTRIGGIENARGIGATMIGLAAHVASSNPAAGPRGLLFGLL